jgi:beta-glucanase (GH16 family)
VVTRRKWFIAIIVFVILSGGGYAIAALTATTGTVSACATSPIQTISANGVKVGTISPKIGCTTVTYTVPTATNTVTSVSTVTVTQPTTTTLPPGEPAPIAGLGYHQVFRDDFATLDRTVWDDHIWYDGPPSPAWTNFQTAESGILNLRSSASYTYPGGNWPINTISTFTSGKSFKYGYFEARMKWTAGQGSWPAFWLIRTDWAQGSGACPGFAGELDVFEGQGSEPNVFYGTVHKDSACSDDQQNINNWQPTSTNLTAGFHTYSALWTPTTITWYLDGVTLMSAPTYSTDNAPMFLLLQQWTGGWDGDPTATTPDPMDNQVDYVDVWQQ